jgi:regulator of sirC expression with transglutaminase-like and TPR domain
MPSLLEVLEAPSPAIEDVALAIAQDEYPGLSWGRYRGVLDAIAEPLAGRARGRLLDDVNIFTDHVYRTHGFRGNNDHYYDPRNSYLNEVLERRVGIPITLAVVLMAVGHRVGLLVEGIGFPGHFLVRVGGPEGCYVDPFNEGQVLEKADLRDLARRFMPGDETVAAAELEPVAALPMAVRMLFNLQQIYEKRGDHARALVVCDRLVDLTGEPFHRRDRGIHALALGAHRVAAADLEAYLDQRPEASDAARIRDLLDKAATPATKPN